MHTIFKRALSLGVTAAMIFSLVACGSKPADDASQPDKDTAKQPSYVFTDNMKVFLSNVDVKFTQQEADYVKLYSKSEMKDGGTVIEIDPTRTYQTIEGFGAAFTDASTHLLTQMPEDKLNEVMTSLFDPNDGIGISIVRNPIGACDFSLDYYTYDDMPEGQDDFELAHFDGSRAKNQIELVKKAMAVNPELKLLLSPWTAPPWMKTIYQYEGINSPALRRECYGVYGKYLAKSIQLYEDEKVPVWAITPQNEMFLPAKWAGMVWDWESMALFVNDYLRPAIDDLGYKTKILHLDYTWTWVKEANNMLASSLNTSDGIAWHWYGGKPEVMQETYDTFPDKIQLVSESTSTRPASVSKNLRVTTMITRSLYSGAGGFMLWNLVLLPTGGPALYPTAYTNTPFISYDPETDTMNYEADFYNMAHFSKYMHVGGKKVYSTDTGADSEYNMVNVAVLNPNGTMTAVMVNATEDDTLCKLVMGDRVLEVPVGRDSTVTVTWDARG